MMFIPLMMFIGGFVTVRVIVKHSSPRQQTKIGGSSPAPTVVFQTQQVSKRAKLIRLRQQCPNLFKVLVRLKRNEPIERWLINAAMREAYDHGDVRTVAKLHRKFGGQDVPQIREHDEDDQPEEDENGEPREDSEPDEEDDGRDHDHEEDGEYLADGDPDDGTIDPETVIGKEASDDSSPLEGIDRASWDQFVESMATQAPSFDSPSHVGKFHQSKRRLQQLGMRVEDVKTPEAQYKAFTEDVIDLRDKGEALINAWQCHPIKIGDGESVVTMSGVLAVLKSAGLEKARSWFESETDRKKFAKTTEMFTKANGAF